MRDVNGRQARLDNLGQFDVVKASDRNVSGHVQSSGTRGAQGADRENVISAENNCRAG